MENTDGCLTFFWPWILSAQRAKNWSRKTSMTTSLTERTEDKREEEEGRGESQTVGSEGGEGGQDVRLWSRGTVKKHKSLR